MNETFLCFSGILIVILLIFLRFLAVSVSKSERDEKERADWLRRELSETNEYLQVLKNNDVLNIDYLENLWSKHKLDDVSQKWGTNSFVSLSSDVKELLASFQKAEKELEVLLKERLEIERKRLETEKRLEKERIQKEIQLEEKRLRKEKEDLEQENYALRVDEIYCSIKERPDIRTILDNFLDNIPEAVFLSAERFSHFEISLFKTAPTGRKILFSHLYLPPSESYDNYASERFADGDFARFSRLLGKTVEFESETDCQFTALRLLQIGAVSYFAKTFAEKCVGIFKDIEELSLVDSLFLYYKKCGDILGSIKQDPAIMLFAYYLIDKRKFGEENDLEYFNVLRRRQELLTLLEENEEEFKFRLFEEQMTRKVDTQNSVTMQDVDLMTGEEFEHFVAKIFQKMGYRAEATQLSGDYGVDVVAEKDGVKIGVQAKRYSGSVSNSAIQEVAAGLSYHECQKGVVVTNSTFTKAAVKLAEANNIQLWDRKALEEKIREIFSEEVK